MRRRSTTMTALCLLAIALQGCLATAGLDRPAPLEQLDSADQALAQGDLETAQRGYEDAIAASPDLISPHFQLGLIAYGRGNDRSAIQRFNAVLERDPGHVLATYNLAMVHLQRARALLKRHESLAPVSAGRPGLLAVRRAIESLGQTRTADR
ncbi:tetratricopeptide repeat protein [Spiribacter insolitus]|uniref:Tetratricopeptide repeat protein n=1 Tax=Spiribacter insolitus TaxID=3122417 RepID=A0ABV3T7J9_9GAMM